MFRYKLIFFSYTLFKTSFETNDKHSFNFIKKNWYSIKFNTFQHIDKSFTYRQI